MSWMRIALYFVFMALIATAIVVAKTWFQLAQLAVFFTYMGLIEIATAIRRSHE